MITRVFNPVNNVYSVPFVNEFKIFLAGTIDNGNSENWQSRFIKKISDTTNKKHNITLFNPRRPSGTEFSSDNKKLLHEQIKWEMKHLDISDCIIMNFLENSKSPISFLELGLYAKDGRTFVICPESFYRYDNIKLVCEKYKLPLFTSENDFWKIFEKIL